MLTFQYLPYHEISGLTTENKLKKLLTIVKTERIILMEGRLEPHEEAKLIEKTMEQISRSFKGIEICTVYPQMKNSDIGKFLKREFLKILGYKGGLTIIGPATIVREIKKDPNKIELLMRNSKRRE